MNPSVAVIDSLASFPFITSENVSGLKAEFPLYAAAAEDIDPSYDPLLLERHESDLPNWSRAARQVLLVQLSSAAFKRVFSLLKNSFGDRQNSALQDYIEASLMLQYNNR